MAKVRAGGALTDAEETALAARLNQPKNFFNEDNLRRAYREPARGLVDFVRAALGTLRIKTREERLEENFRAWLVSRSFSPEQAEYLALLKNRGVATGHVTLDDLFRPPLSILNVAGLGVELFGEDGLTTVVQELNDRVIGAA